MLDPKGNTAVYVLYAYARIAGVLRRAENNVASLSPSDLALTEPSDTWSRKSLQGQRSLAAQEYRLHAHNTNICSCKWKHVLRRVYLITPSITEQACIPTVHL